MMMHHGQLFSSIQMDSNLIQLLSYGWHETQMVVRAKEYGRLWSDLELLDTEISDTRCYLPVKVTQ
jgi:hypothetical protein